MIDYKAVLQPDRGQPATHVTLVDKPGHEAWLNLQGEQVRGSAAAQGFAGEAGQLAILPGERQGWSVVLGVKDRAQLGVWDLAKAAAALPEGTYRLDEAGPGEAALGWLLAHYRFGRYRTKSEHKGPRVLLTDAPARIDGTVALARATALVRDLVNTPAEDMGPAELQTEVERLGVTSGGAVTVTAGRALEDGYPMIHAVGRAATPERAPRLLELVWGDPAHPRVAIVGKGVCFDSGGLDIKPASGMRLMKKDMGGAAHAIALAQLVMEHRLPVRLHLLVPAVENAISAPAFRPGDILKSRKGLKVEIGNTDAEGRLILGDALTRAGEGAPELILDFATLTGAARVALGPDLPALFADDEALAADLIAASGACEDPLWRMPLWTPYEELLASDIADIANAGDSPFAGAVTAALFLRKFVPDNVAWAHQDTFAWMASAKPGRPKGGEALGLRASFAFLARRYPA